VKTCLAEADRRTSELVRRACEQEPDQASDLWSEFVALRAAGLLGKLGKAASGAAESPVAGAAGSVVAGEAPEIIGPYRVLSEIGRGGQAVVYLAEDTRLNRPVALKVLSVTEAGAELRMQRFRREAEVASKLDHRGICPVFDAGTQEGAAYIAMRYVAGTTLAACIAESRKKPRSRSGSIGLALPTGGSGSRDASGPTRSTQRTSRTGAGTTARPNDLHAALRLVEQIARALHAAHEAGVVHRDIKPGNIMVTPGGEPVILDFGLAGGEEGGLQGLTRTGDVMGTPAYMSPEQIAGPSEAIDRRTDVFSLGVTLFECLTLERPFDAPSREALHRVILEDEPPDPRKRNPRISADLAVVIATALEKSLNRRYQTALAFADDLRRIREKRPIAARPISRIGRLVRWAKRRPARAALWITALLGLPVLAGLLGFIIATRPVVIRQEEQALRTRIDGLLQEGFDEYYYGLPDRARTLFDQALASRPDSAEAVAGQTLILRREHRYQESLDLLNQHRELVDRVPALMHLEATALESVGRKREADDRVRRIHAPRSDLDFFLEGVSKSDFRAIKRDQAQAREGFACLLTAVLSAPRKRDYRLHLLAHVAGYLTKQPYAKILVWALKRGRPDHPDTWISIGRAISIIDPKASVAAFRKAFALSSGRGSRRMKASNYINYGVSLGLNGQTDEAVAVYREALALEPDNATAHSNLGNSLAVLGQTDQAISALERAIRLQPDFAKAHNKLGVLWFKKRQWKRAIASFKRAVAFHPDDPAYRVNLGNAYHGNSETNRAVAAYEKAIQLDPNRVDAWNNLGVIEFDRKAWDRAIAAFERTAVLDPGNASAHTNLGNAHAEKGNRDQAIAAYETALEIQPRNVQVLEWLALLYRDAKKMDRAIELFERAVELKPEARRYATLARLYGQNGQQEKRIAACRNAVELAPRDPIAAYNYGFACQQSGRLDEAIAAYRKAIEIDPENAWAHYSLGNAYHDKGRRREAVASFQEALRIDPGFAWAHTQLGIEWFDQGDWDRAIQRFERALELKPDLSNARFNLGLAHSRKGEWRKAAPAFREAFRMDRRDGKALYHFARSQEALGRLDRALTALERLAKMTPEDARVHCLLGGVHRQRRDWDAAASSYRNAIRLHPDDRDAVLGLSACCRLQGRFREALELLREGREQAPAGGSDAHPFARRIAELERLIALENALDSFLCGRETPEGAADSALLAEICFAKKNWAVAVRLWKKALAQDAESAADGSIDWRHDSIRAAVLAAAVADREHAKIEPEEASALRGYALRGLKAEITANEAAGTSCRLERLLRCLQADPDFASVRNPAALDELPESERRAWQSFWTDLKRRLEALT